MRKPIMRASAILSANGFFRDDGRSYDPGMRIAEKVRKLLQEDDWTQQRLAERLGVSQSTVNRWVKGAEPEGHRRDAINELFTIHFESVDSEPASVQLLGFVGAGQAVYPFDDAGGGYVEAPPKVMAGTVAVEVRGESMLPLYEDGTLLYYSKHLPPEEMIGRRVIAKLADDRVLVKTLRRGSDRGLWTLVSLNAPDIEDVAIQWVAPIDWIKPRQ